MRPPLPQSGIAPGGDPLRGRPVLRAYSLYRLVIATLVLAVALLGAQGQVFGVVHGELFGWGALAWFVTVALALSTSLARHPGLDAQALLQALLDVAAFGLLIATAGGWSSGLAILLVVVVAGSAIVLPLARAALVGALAWAVAAGLWLHGAWSAFAARAGHGAEFPHPAELLDFAADAGYLPLRLALLGLALAAAIATAWLLAERARRSEALAAERALALRELAELNQRIIQHLQSGIIVVDRGARVRLMNQAAAELLGIRGTPEDTPLAAIAPALAASLEAWLSAPGTPPLPFRAAAHLPELLPEFTALSGLRARETLVFLEDSAQAAQRLQQLKLAALGRLTASIAHEIRNPLAAVSHAAQLLDEAAIDPALRRLTKIVHDNAVRTNRIIADVLELSRRDGARPEDIALGPWLEEFRHDFLRSRTAPLPTLELRVEPPTLRVRFDPGQLRQVLLNLCDNACQHGTRPGDTPRLRLRAGLEPGSLRPLLDVVDSGAGIPEADVPKAFEPFFTTSPRGTGLGLYIAREMCESNRAHLQYLRDAVGGSYFRLVLTAPERHQDV